MSKLSNTLGQDAFWLVNKTIAKTLSIKGALLLSDLISKLEHLRATNSVVTIDDKDYFYYTAEDIEKYTTIPYKSQKKCFDLMKELGLIECRNMGVPRKMYFYINEEAVMTLLETGELIMPKVQNWDCPNGRISNAQTAEIYNKNKYTKNKEIKIENKYIQPDEFLSASIEAKIAETDKALVYPFETFDGRRTWEILRRTEKWRKKTFHALQLSLNKLSQFPEEFQIILMKDAIEGNWQGVVFDSTDQKFENWKKKNTNKDPLSFIDNWNLK